MSPYKAFYQNSSKDNYSSDLGRIETWAYRNLMKLNTGKWQALYLGGSNPCHTGDWWAEKTAWAKSSGSSGWPKVAHKSMMCPCDEEGQHFPGMRWSFSFTQAWSGASGLLGSALASSVEEKQGHAGVSSLKAHKGSAGI